METFLVLNGFEIDATVDQQEELMLALAAGELDRSDLVQWVSEHLARRG